jgi:hypothetical protein
MVFFLGGRSATDAVRGFGELAGLPLAAVLRQVAEQGIHLREVGAVDQVASARLAADQARVGQFLEVERERAGRHAELLGDHAGRQAGRAGHDQGTKGTQALRLGQCGQRLHGAGLVGEGIRQCRFHISMIVEIGDDSVTGIHETVRSHKTIAPHDPSTLGWG